MAKRVRYVHTEDPNLIRSSKAFKTSAGKWVYAFIHKVSLQFNISDATTREIYASGGSTKNLGLLLKQAKTALVHLGVEFSEDTRTFKEDSNETVVTEG